MNRCDQNLILAAILLVVSHVDAASERRMDNISSYAVGFTYPGIRYLDQSRCYKGNPREIEVMLWYPISTAIHSEERVYGFWKIKPAVMLDPNELKNIFDRKLPLVFLSHGFGGDSFDSAWFAHKLASAGYLVASIKHYGNSFDNTIPYISARPWMRPLDISFVLDKLLSDDRFKNIIDSSRIGAAGFSQGGITVLWLAGLSAHLNDEGLRKQISGIEDCDWKSIFEEFTQDDIKDANRLYQDERIKAVFAMAPGIDFHNWMFTGDGFSDVVVPVSIVVGDADTVVAADEHAKFFAQHMPNTGLTVLSPHVGHWTFLNEATEEGKKINPKLTVDHPSVDRAQIHKQVGKMAVEFFNAAMP